MIGDENVNEQVRRCWGATLGNEPEALESDFFEEGGDSLAAVQLINAIHIRLGVRISVRDFVGRPTFEGLLSAVRSGARSDASFFPEPIVMLQDGGVDPPIICVHAAAGTATRFVPLIRSLEPTHNAYGLQSLGVDEDVLRRYGSFDEMVAAYVDAVTTVADPPYVLLGYSLGGIIAFEMARRLEGAGRRVALLALLDAPSKVSAVPLRERLSWFVQRGLQIEMDLDELSGLNEYARAKAIRAAALDGGVIDDSVSVERVRTMEGLYGVNVDLVSDYTPCTLDTPALLLHVAPELHDGPADHGWSAHLPRLWSVEIPGDHFSMMRPPHVADLADALSAGLSRLTTAEAVRSDT